MAAGTLGSPSSKVGFQFSITSFKALPLSRGGEFLSRNLEHFRRTKALSSRHRRSSLYLELRCGDGSAICSFAAKADATSERRNACEHLGSMCSCRACLLSPGFYAATQCARVSKLTPVRFDCKPDSLFLRLSRVAPRLHSRNFSTVLRIVVMKSVENGPCELLIFSLPAAAFALRLQRRRWKVTRL